jgi:hypothetical protein
VSRRVKLQAVALLLAAKDGKRAVNITGHVASAWRALKDAAVTLGIDASFHETHKIVRLSDGGTVRVLGPRDMDKARGQEHHAVVANARTEAVERAFGPRMAEHGWIAYVDEAANHMEPPATD